MVATLLVAACASGPSLAPALGPTVAVRVDSETVLLPRPRVFHHDGRVEAHYDAADDSTTVAIVIHPGRYFLWIQHPRITVRFRYAGRMLTHAPHDVVMDVRVQHPQQPDVSTLILTATDGPRFSFKRVVFHESEDVLVTNLDYAFELPLGTFARLITSESLSLELGGITATFDGGQMEALRDLASRMAPADTGR